MAEGRDRQEPHKPGQVANQRLGSDLLTQVQVDVGLQCPLPVGRRPHEGDRPVPQRGVKIEVSAELLGDERVHDVPQGSAREQVRAARLQLPRARAQEHETQAALLDELVHVVEKARDALHLVDDHPVARTPRAQLVGEQLGIGEQALVAALVEEIDPVSPFERVRAQVLLPTPRTPNRKKDCSGARAIRG